MEMYSHSDLVPRIIVDNFLPYEELIEYNRQFCSVFTLAKDGDLVVDGKAGVIDKAFKVRKEFPIYELSNQLNLTMPDIWRRNLWSEKLRRFYCTAGGVFHYMNITTSDMLLGAFYGEGGFYKAHADLAVLTAVFFHQSEKAFEGGDFMLGTTTKWNEQESTFFRIPYKQNRLLIFPSRFVHFAEPVTKCTHEGVSGMRWCTQNFLGFDGDYKK